MDVFFSITGCRVFWRDGQVLSSRRWTDKLNKQLLHKHYAPPLQRDRIFYWVGMFFLQKDNNNEKKHCTYKCFFWNNKSKHSGSPLHCYCNFPLGGDKLPLPQSRGWYWIPLWQALLIIRSSLDNPTSYLQLTQKAFWYLSCLCHLRCFLAQYLWFPVKT